MTARRPSGGIIKVADLGHFAALKSAPRSEGSSCCYLSSRYFYLSYKQHSPPTSGHSMEVLL